MTGAEDRLRSLIERHCQTLRINAAAIAARMPALSIDSPDRTQALADATDVAHQMAGAGGSIGFRDVSTAAKALELRMRPLVGQPIPDETERRAVLGLFDDLQRIVSGLQPEHSAIYNADLSKLGGMRRDAG